MSVSNGIATNEELTVRIVPAAVVRALIEARLRVDDVEATLGSITLRPHQRTAVARIRRAMADVGGALLADEPGLGKSYVALAVAAGYDDGLLICPAALRDTWSAAMGAAGVRMRLVSQEALSRGTRPEPASLVVVDEAHHFRNPATRRYRELARIAADARVLMLTATPVHNSERDLRALIALFRGRDAVSDDGVLARCLVRRTHADSGAGALAVIAPTRVIDVAEQDARVVELIAALPPPLPLTDGADAAALVQMTLLRQWASSAAALRGGIDRHLARTDALLAALEAGRLPTRSELASWTMGDDAMQLAFPELVASRSVVTGPWIEGASRHRQAVLQLRGTLRSSRSDERRASLLRDLLHRHRDDRILCFAQFEETIRMYWRALRLSPGVCALSSRGATVVGGALSRRDAIARFAPRANGAPMPERAQEIRVLLATDMLSEGVNLQDASVVVHLDTPWTPARLEQRVGRAARLSSTHDVVSVYSLRAPLAAARLLAIERRLHAKSVAATRAQHIPDAAERVVRCIAAWRGDAGAVPASGVPSIARVRGATRGWLALVGNGTGVRLVASLGEERSASATLVADACLLAAEGDAPCDQDDVRAALRELQQWLREDRAAAAAGLRDGLPTGRRAPLRQVAAAASGVPRSRRAGLEDAAAAAWRMASAPMSLGREARLRAAGAMAARDRDWLLAICKINGGNELASNDPSVPQASWRPIALILLGS